MTKKIATRIGTNLLVSAGSILFTLILMEITLRLFFPVSDMPLSAYDPAVGMHLAPNQTGTWVVGAMGEVRGHYQVNAAGWNSIHEYSSSKPADTFRIAVIGDSYVEALGVDVDKSFPAVLERALQSTPACKEYSNIEVYSFGYAGSQLAHYLSIMRYVSERYDPDLYVINIVANDFEESIINPFPRFMSFRQTEEGKFVEVPPVPYSPPMRNFLKSFALARYVYLNLIIREVIPALGPSRQQSAEVQPVAGGPQNPQPTAADQDTMARLTAHILDEYQALAVRDDSDLLLVVDADRQAIYQNATSAPVVVWQNSIISQTAADLGISLMDLTPIFSEDYQQNGKPFNSSVDYHWNEYGNTVVGTSVGKWVADHVCLPAGSS